MNKVVRNIVIGGVGIGIFFGSVDAISEKTATIGAVGGGVALGLLAGGLTYGATQPFSNGDGAKSLVPAVLVGVATTAISWWLLDQWLTTLTPQGRLNAAMKLVRWVESDSLVMREFATSEELVSYINVRFGTSWPLVLAREHIMNLTNGIGEVFGLVDLVRQDLADDASWSMTTKCKELEGRAGTLVRALELRMNLIASHRDYQFQVGLYERHKEAERQREHEAALKAGERAHESWERTRDRYHESEEKEKDRRLKQQALDIAMINHGPVMVGI